MADSSSIVVYAAKKLHQYLFGRQFHLITDHKPLLSIFNPGAAMPSKTASRLHRWALVMSAYNFTLEYVSTDQNTADDLSRIIAAYNVLKKETCRDPLLSRVVSYIKDVWPHEIEDRDLKPYLNRRRELYLELGCVMLGHRVVIPNTCREKVLNE